MRKVLLLSLSLLFLPLSFGKLSNLFLEPNIFEEKEKVEVNSPKWEIPKELTDFLKHVKLPEEARPSIWPVVGVITSQYGWRRRRWYKEFHPGIDIAAPTGTPVVATADGVVIFSGWVRGYGYVIVIYHGYGYTTVYAHLSAREVYKGDLVAKGSVIGYVGSTGRTTGPHLHYEVLKYGIRQNPILYLP